MHIVRPEVDVKWLFRRARRVDERQRGVGEAGGDLGALHPGDRLAEALGIGPDAPGLVVAGLEREREQLGTHALEIRQRGVETIGRDRRGIVHVALAAHVPFAEMAGGVACVVQHAREHGGLRIEPLGHAARGRFRRGC